ncbi:MAG: hypothetical protein RLZZ511_4444 [Cyanobacteriota bacterium]|jgi:hypothetical protein
MKPEELIKMCDTAINRWGDETLPKLPGEPQISFLWQIGRPLPQDFFGIEYQCYSVRRGTAIRIPAKPLKQKLEYALMEGFG